MANSTISILNAKDSTLYKFGRASNDGSFKIDGLKPGKLILLVTYPDFADYVEHFTLELSKEVQDFGKIYMTSKARLLKEVIIKGKAASIKIKGDTTEYNAAAYVIQPNAKVEDLLKQLPGIQIDNDGKITAQGQRVNKVLVDGEEFFGDDPTLVTKNIRGDMVDKIQLYDKKSDQASFTGVDDGKKTKTINVKLKADSKNGYFGKAEAGYGTDNFYQSQIMYNYFKDKSKVSVYGITSTTGKIGLGWEDSNRYGGNSVQLGDGGMFLSTGSHDDLESFDGNYNGQGLPTARTGGIHYDHKWNNDLQSINTNYKIGYLSVEGHKNTQTQNILPSETIKSNADQNFDNNIFRQKLDLTFETRIDTSSTLKLVADATVKNSKTRDNFSSFTQNESDTLLNKNSRSLINNADQQIFNMTEFYARKFKKKGRTLSLNLSQYINDSNAKGYLNSTTNFYNSQTSALDSTQITNQYKTNNTRNAFIGGNITYTESIFKSLSLVVNYGIGWNTSSADRKSFNASSTGMFTVLDTTYSNNYQLNQLSNQLGAILAYNTGKSIFNFGTKATETGYDQTNKYTGGIFKRSFLNWNPTASFQYKFAQQRELKVSYTGNSVQPNIDQIQPIRINSDPLNINIGNQFLKPSFNNAINLTYSSYKTLNNQSIWFNGAYNFTENAIVNNVFTDNTGKNTFQAVNLSGHTNYNYTVGGYFVQRLKHLDVDAGFDMTATGNVSFNMVNNVLNAVKTYTYSTNLLLSKYKQKGYDLRLYTGPNYTISTASLQPDVNNNGFGFNANADCKLYLPGKFKLISNFNYQYKAQTKAFEQSFSRVIINATISKAFLKQQNLQFSVSGNDLLNQNQDFVRSNFGNLITQTFNSTIKRYILFSVTWDFSQMFKKSSSTNK